MSSRTVSLPDQLTAFVDRLVQSGRHQDAGEVVREALRRYQSEVRAEGEHLAAIREAIREGRDAIARGDFRTISGADGTAALLARLTHRDSA